MNAGSLALQLAGLVTRVSPDWAGVMAGPRPRAFLVSFLNPYSLWVARQEPGYLALLQRFDVLHADGLLMAKLASRATGSAVERVSFDGNSLAPLVFGLAAGRAARVAIVGGRLGVAEAAARVFQAAGPIDIAMTRSGYFASPAERAQCHDTIRRAGIDLVICGMGAPYQERFLDDLAATGWAGVGFTCGGYLDQAAESGLKYYPEWVNRLNLRAPYRLAREPRRLAKRYFVHYMPFYLEYLGLMLGGGRAGNP